MALVRFDAVTEPELEDYLADWEASGEEQGPVATRRQGRGFAALQRDWQEAETGAAFDKGFVPATLYFFKDEKGTVVGAIHLRHVLNDRLRLHGGHIGYGIRPSHRRRGHAKAMLKALLASLDTAAFPGVLLTCADDNAGSIATIESCGGRFQDRLKHEGILTRRYWIEVAAAT